MCGNASALTYSPRRLVALTSSGKEADRSDPSEGASDHVRTSRVESSGSAGDSPLPPSDRPRPSASLRNLMVPMPLGRKIRLVVRNTAIKIKTRQTCCGHPGEPGC